MSLDQKVHVGLHCISNTAKGLFCHFLYPFIFGRGLTRDEGKGFSVLTLTNTISPQEHVHQQQPADLGLIINIDPLDEISNKGCIVY